MEFFNTHIYFKETFITLHLMLQMQGGNQIVEYAQSKISQYRI